MTDYKEEKIMNDKITKIGNGTIIQHGKFNNRIYLIKIHRNDFPGVIYELNSLAYSNKYKKIFCKIPAWAVPEFIADDFIIEAIIPRFYNGIIDAFFVSKFLDSERLLNLETDKLSLLSSLLSEGSKEKPSFSQNSEFTVRELKFKDIPQITEIYKKVFVTYPFPIHEPEYIEKTMKENVQYFGIENDDTIIAISSAELNIEGANAEMTDFATIPEFRAKKLSLILLDEMERLMKEQGVKTVYTIARLNSVPMNKTFLRFGYSYSGTLIKNTNISGKIESMNVLYKYL